MTWFAFKGYNGGAPIDLAGVQEKDAVALGFHGYASAILARRNPNSVNFVQAPFVDGFIADYGFAVKSGEQPGGPNASILSPADQARGNLEYALNSTGLGGLGRFLSSRRGWVRIAEGTVGAALLLAGINGIIHAATGTDIAGKIHPRLGVGGLL